MDSRRKPKCRSLVASSSFPLQHTRCRSLYHRQCKFQRSRRSSTSENSRVEFCPRAPTRIQRTASLSLSDQATRTKGRTGEPLARRSVGYSLIVGRSQVIAILSRTTGRCSSGTPTSTRRSSESLIWGSPRSLDDIGSLHKLPFRKPSSTFTPSSLHCLAPPPSRHDYRPFE